MNELKRIGIVGTGVIGASWAAYFLAQGLDVNATDPANEAENKLRTHVASLWPMLKQIGLKPGASLDRLSFDSDLKTALADCDFIQENGPERIDIKRKLMADIDAAIREDVLISSSSSGIVISDIQDAAKHPERILLGHPFNPPHLIPLVEIVGGKLTSTKAINQAIAFYRGIGKKPIHLRREIKGHIANRLQAALMREAINLLEQGVASVADIDAAVSYGPGLRWALMGPFMILEEAGGEGGLAQALTHLGPAMEVWWKDLGTLTSLNDDIKSAMTEGVNEECKPFSPEKMIEQRDAALMLLLHLKSKFDQIP
jgi:3-hydroxyacyl-CoA dehydrogenase